MHINKEHEKEIMKGKIMLPKNFKDDYRAMTEKSFEFLGGGRIIKHRPLRINLAGRCAASDNFIISLFGRIWSSHYERNYGIELNYKNIGGGLLLMHPYNITVNSRAILGKNVTLFKDITIGSVRSGPREGVPKIEDRVAIMPGAVVVGNITVGHDTLIAANAMVDFDIPPHSVVFGNPAQVRHKQFASKDYLTGR